MIYRFFSYLFIFISMTLSCFAVTDFDINLYNQICKDNGNIVVSPFNISRAMLMLYAGSAGKTAQEISDVMFFPKYSDELVPSADNFYIANSLWIQEGFPLLPSYLQIFDDDDVQMTNFWVNPDRSREEINSWVEEKTLGKIENLFSEGTITSDARLVLASAIYFKGQWEHQFNPKNTYEGTFYVDGDDPITKTMMHQENDFSIFVDSDFYFLELPYDNDNVSMFILLPREIDGLDDIEFNISEWIASMERKKVSVTLPKFDIVDSRSLDDTLQEMGITLAFSPNADFSNITGQRDLFLSTIVHQAAVTVDEKGTEAAAATGAVMNLTAVLTPEPEIQFCVDHPFIYMIMDKTTQSLLFFGRLSK